MAELTLSLNVTDSEMFASISQKAISLGRSINQLESEIDGDFTTIKRAHLNLMRLTMGKLHAGGDIVKLAQILALIKTEGEKEVTSI